ncbi:MAG: hypothetical protein KAI75_09255, partial [Desulfobulbaceae bacterium]|nr:hypothetical protein [Desulfobulbaceae bacterium]
AVDENMHCIYANKHFYDKFNKDLSDIKARWDEVLPLVGIHGVSYDTFAEKALDLFNADANSVTVLNLSRFSYIVFTKMIVLFRDRELRLVSVLFRGERK